MESLTPKVIEATDVTTYERGSGKRRDVTRVTYLLGELGPFIEEFDRATFSDSELQLRIDTKRRALERHT